MGRVARECPGNALWIGLRFPVSTTMVKQNKSHLETQLGETPDIIGVQATEEGCIVIKDPAY